MGFQCVVDQVKAFVFGGMQEFEILLDGGCFGRVTQELVVCHAEPRGGVHVIHVLVVEERPRLPYKRIDYMTKVDRFLTAAELPRHTLEAFILVPMAAVLAGSGAAIGYTIDNVMRGHEFLKTFDIYIM